ncbi:E3 ubiquitin-protein ligase HUWE1, partial [Acipenser ruthenus]
PADCRALIDKLKACHNEQLLQELQQIKTWNIGKCELYHWVDLLDRFDGILADAGQTVETMSWMLVCDRPANCQLKSLLLAVLNFTALLIEYSFSRHLYSSIEHLTTLLASCDMQVVLAVLNLLYSWGGKDNGFGLAECCRDLAMMISESPSEIMESLTLMYSIPKDKQILLFTHIRLAHGFSNHKKRLQAVQARLHAISILVYSNALQDSANSILYNGLIEELVDVLQITDKQLMDIKAASLRTLTSIVHLERTPKLSSIIDCTGTASYHGFLPALVIKFLGDEQDQITFVTRAVRVVDLITNLDMAAFQSHTGLAIFISRLEHEVELCRKECPFVIKPKIHRPSTGQEGEDMETDMDVSDVAMESSPGPSVSTEQRAEGESRGQTSASLSFTPRPGVQCIPQRAALLKSMLNFLKKAIQDPAFSDGIRHVMDGSLPTSLKHIISNAEYYGPSLFLLVFVFQEPSLLSSLQDNGLTDVMLHALLIKDVPATREVLGSLPNVFSALCLNARGLQSFVQCQPFGRLFKVLLSPDYLPAMRRRRSSDPLGDTASNLGSAVDELMRHQPTLKTDATTAIIKLLEEICNLGRAPEYICQKPSIQKADGTATAPPPRSNHAAEEASSEDEEEEEVQSFSTAQQGEPEPSQQVVGTEERIPIPLMDYILNVMKFVESILSNNTTDDHCQEFVTQKGLLPLVSILGLPNLPIDFPTSAACQAVAGVCKSILTLSHEPKVLQESLLQLDGILSSLELLHRPIDSPGGSVLLRELASAGNVTDATLSAQATPLLHSLTAAHAYIMMFVHTCRSEIRAISVNQWGSQLGLNVLNKLSQLYCSLVWESTVLLSLCTPNRLTFFICSVGFTSPMLFDERKYPYHLMLQKFFCSGGHDALFETFNWALSMAGKVPVSEGLEHSDLPDGTGEFLDAWLMLVEKMVNPTTVLESPHSLPAKLPGGGPNQPQFSALRFLVVTQKASFDCIQNLWNRKPLKVYGARMAESMLAILCHILRGEPVIREQLAKEKEGTRGPGEEEGGLTPEEGPAPRREPLVNQPQLQQLMDMGFTREHAMESLLNTSTMEQATEYLLTHPPPLLGGVVRMMRAIAMSLGEDISMEQQSDSPEDTSRRQEEEERRAREKQEEDEARCLEKFQCVEPLGAEELHAFTDTMLPGCFTLLDELPDTVYRVCDLIMTAVKRNGPEYREMILRQVVNQVWEAADVLIKAALPLTTSDTKTVLEWTSQMATLPQASNLATRILLLTLLFEVRNEAELRLSCARVVESSGVLDVLIKLLEVVQPCLQAAKEQKEVQTPKWITPVLLLIDFYEKTAVSSKRRAQMNKYLQPNGNNWRWFDDRSGRWCSYSAGNNGTIDAAWRSGESSVRFTAGRRRYTVQFNTMVQVNEETGNRRPVTLTVQHVAALTELSSSSSSAAKDSDQNKEPGSSVCPSAMTAAPDEAPAPSPSPPVVIQGLSEDMTTLLIRACVSMISVPVDPDTLHATLRLCLRLTRTHQYAMMFAELRTPRMILGLAQSSGFNGFTPLVTLLFRHIIEDPATLRHTMEKVVRSAVTSGAGSTTSGVVSGSLGSREINYILRVLGPAACRDPDCFTEAATNCIRIALPAPRGTGTGEEGRGEGICIALPAPRGTGTGEEGRGEGICIALPAPRGTGTGEEGRGEGICIALPAPRGTGTGEEGRGEGICIALPAPRGTGTGEEGRGEGICIALPAPRGTGTGEEGRGEGICIALPAPRGTGTGEEGRGEGICIALPAPRGTGTGEEGRGEGICIALPAPRGTGTGEEGRGEGICIALPAPRGTGTGEEGRGEGICIALPAPRGTGTGEEGRGEGICIALPAPRGTGTGEEGRGEGICIALPAPRGTGTGEEGRGEGICIALPAPRGTGTGEEGRGEGICIALPAPRGTGTGEEGRGEGICIALPAPRGTGTGEEGRGEGICIALPAPRGTGTGEEGRGEGICIALPAPRGTGTGEGERRAGGLWRAGTVGEEGGGAGDCSVLAFVLDHLLPHTQSAEDKDTPALARLFLASLAAAGTGTDAQVALVNEGIGRSQRTLRQLTANTGHTIHVHYPGNRQPNPPLILQRLLGPSAAADILQLSSSLPLQSRGRARLLVGNDDVHIIARSDDELLDDFFHEQSAPGAQAGEGLPASDGAGGQSQTIQEEPLPSTSREEEDPLAGINLPEGVDPSFLAALPEDIRREVLQNQLGIRPPARPAPSATPPVPLPALVGNAGVTEILRQSTTHLADGPFAVLVDYIRILDFDVKRKYFRQELERLDEGLRKEDMAVHVRRDHVFEDSYRELHRKSPEEMKNRLYIVFEGEEGQDAGGLLREWYMIISREMFNAMYALFRTSPGDRVTYTINPSSHCNPNHLSYFKFVGRVVAKAGDRQHQQQVRDPEGWGERERGD